MQVRRKEILEAFLWTAGPDQTEDPEWLIEAFKSGEAGLINEGTPEVEMYATCLTCCGSDYMTYSSKPGNYLVKEHDGMHWYSPEGFKDCFEVVEPAAEQKRDE